MKLTEIQTTVRDTLKAVPLFANDLVVSDNGLQEDEMNAALNGRGFCIAVSPILHGGATVDAQGHSVNPGGTAALLTARLVASVRVNVTRNAAQKSDTDPGGANIDPLEAVATVIRAVLAWANKNNPTEKRFEVDGDGALTLAADDPGVLTWDIRFKKTATA